MKHTRRILCALLTLCMVIGAIPTLYLASAAEEAEKVNLALESIISKADGVNVTADLANGLVDNEPGGDYWSAYGYSCIEDPIANDSGAWFSVDLGSVCEVDSVRVFERVASGDEILDYFTNWEVYGTDDAAKPLTEWTKLGEKKTEEKVRPEGYEAVFASPASVRYLRIYGTKTTSTASNYFQLCEIEVWGPKPAPKPIETASEATNIMANANATVRKSDRDVTPELTNGITDIDYYDDYWSAYGTPSDDSVEGEHSWFEMDLGGVCVVDAVTIIERLTDGDDNLLDYYTNWELYASLDAGAPISEWTKVGEKKNEVAVCVDGYTVEFEAPVVTRYLRVYCTKTTSTASSRFQLTEVEVWTGMKSMVRFEGYQIGLDGTSIRFGASVNNPDLAEVGMKIEVASANKSFDCKDTKVCKTLQYTDEDGELANALTTADSGVSAMYATDAAYLFGFSIVDIDPGEYVFTITPIATMADGTVYQGETVTVTITI